MKTTIITVEDLKEMTEINSTSEFKSTLALKSMNQLLKLKEEKEKEIYELDEEILIRNGVGIWEKLNLEHGIKNIRYC